MKVKIIAQIENEVEISIPSYYKSLCYYHKVFSEDRCISICTLDNYESIGMSSNSVAFNSGIPEEITEVEFNQMLNLISTNLLSL